MTHRWVLTDTIGPSQSGPGSNGNEGILHSWSLTIKCNFKSYPEPILFWGSGLGVTFLQLIQSAYILSPVDRAMIYTKVYIVIIWWWPICNFMLIWASILWNGEQLHQLQAQKNWWKEFTVNSGPWWYWCFYFGRILISIL